MTSSDKPSNDDNPIAGFLRTIPTPFLIIFVTFVWAGSLYQSLEPYDLSPIVTYGIIVVTAIPVGLLFQRLLARI